MAVRMWLAVAVLVAVGVASLAGCRVGSIGADGGVVVGDGDDGGDEDPVGPQAPAIVAGPSSLTVAAGSSVVLTVTATGDELSYRWEQDAGLGWTTVADATGDSWTTRVLGLGDDGLAVRCVVKNTLGEATSQTATLTVRRVRMVRPGGTGTGTSWTDALPGVAEAMALTADDADEVWVAAGTYVPAGTDRSATFRLPADVALYGGFAGSEQGREERNPASNETVLSGNAGTPGDGSDDAYHVVTAVVGGHLDGFTVRDGRADGAAYPADSGGGMIVVDCSPTVTGCRFVLNTAVAGGGVYVRQGSPSFTDCRVEGNSATRAGGMALMANSTATLTDCTFSANAATGAYGGAVVCDASTAFLRCLFQGNAAVGSGGALYVSYGRSTLTDCALRGNTAGSGGAVCGYDALQLTATNCEFTGNSATSSGGAVLFIQGGFAVSSLYMVNCTLVGNVGQRAGALVVDDASFHVSNCLVWNNDALGTPQIDVGAGAVSHCCVEGGFAGTANVSGDPRFVDEAGGDYRIGAGSSCIDGADGTLAPELDMDGLPRWDDPTVTGVDSSPYADIGAHEYQGF